MKIAKLPVLMFALALAFVGFTDSGKEIENHVEAKGSKAKVEAIALDDDFGNF